MNTYQLYITGNSISSRFYSLTEEASEFWQEQIDDEDSDLLEEYCQDREGMDICEEYHFLGEHEDQYSAESLIAESESFNLSDCDIVVEQDEKELYRWQIYNEDEDDYTVEVDWVENHPCVENPILSISETMKGTIFGGVIECETFNPEKIKITLSEDYHGEFALDKVYYDGKELEDTLSAQRGKGGFQMIIRPDDY